MSASSHQGEEAVIQRHFAPLAAGYAGAFGLRDDCAAIAPPPGCDLVVKTDPVRAGVHFFADDRPEDIAWKALAVNISDLAAKGARPLGYLAALSFPERPPEAWLAAFARGLTVAQSAFGCHLLGGDTDRAAGPLSIAITAFGTVPTGRMVRRATARAGDIVVATGSLGDAALGLKLRRGDVLPATWYLDNAAAAHLLQRYQRPTPRLPLTPALLAHASAAMDISDGLLKDIDRMCRAAQVGSRLDAAHLPLSPAARTALAADPALQPLIWSGGDDYEILCTVAPAHLQAFTAEARVAGVATTAIGTITEATGCALVDATGRPIVVDRQGWDHF